MYQKHGAYWYVKSGKWQKLGTDLHGALQEYARIIAVPADGMPALLDAAFPHLIEGLSASTVTQYAASREHLKEVFKDFYPEQVTHGSIVEMMDLFKDRKAVANRLLTVLKLTFQWALDRGKVSANPAISVKRYVMQARSRLITPREYAAIYGHCPPWLQCIMDMCYLTGQRIGDVLKIERQHLQDDGIFIEQQKTGKRLVVAWTPELRAVVERAKGLQGKVAHMHYLLGGRGGKIRRHTNVWRVFKDAADKAGVMDVTLHDLRAMAGTEVDAQGGNPSALLGHSDARTTQIYLRDKRPKVVKGPAKKAG